MLLELVGVGLQRAQVERDQLQLPHGEAHGLAGARAVLARRPPADRVRAAQVLLARRPRGPAPLGHARPLLDPRRRGEGRGLGLGLGHRRREGGGGDGGDGEDGDGPDGGDGGGAP
ncbi:hypothetical protein EG858_15775, partial [Enterococcus faecalis]